jgi:hypothetical protein
MPIVARFGGLFMGVECSIGGPNPARHDGAETL